jgi:hypothetical protein
MIASWSLPDMHVLVMRAVVRPGEGSASITSRDELDRQKAELRAKRVVGAKDF